MEEGVELANRRGALYLETKTYESFIKEEGQSIREIHSKGSRIISLSDEQKEWVGSRLLFKSKSLGLDL